MTNAARLLSQLTEAATDLSAVHGTGDALAWWAAALERTCRDHHDDSVWMAPWVELPALAEAPDLQRLSALVTAIDDGLSLRDIAWLPTTIIPALDEVVEDLSGPRVPRRSKRSGPPSSTGARGSVSP